MWYFSSRPVRRYQPVTVLSPSVGSVVEPLIVGTDDVQAQPEPVPKPVPSCSASMSCERIFSCSAVRRSKASKSGGSSYILFPPYIVTNYLCLLDAISQ